MLEGNTDDDESGMSIKRDMKGSRIDSGVAYIREDFKQAVQLHIFYPSFLKKFPFFFNLQLILTLTSITIRN